MKIGLIGAGKMGTALVHGAVKSGAILPNNVLLADKFPETAELSANAIGGSIAESNTQVAEHADVIILATKPAGICEVIEEISPILVSSPNTLLVSIAAGIKLDQLEASAPAHTPIIRTMPNTPVLVGTGACAYALGKNSTEQHSKIIESLLSSVCEMAQIEERLMDVITGLSGSGPAYVYSFIEALTESAIAEGLPTDIATRFAAQTLIGGAKMVLETGEHPADLRAAVCSPNGTTVAGLAAMEDAGFSQAAQAAVTAATKRSIELGQ